MEPKDDEFKALRSRVDKVSAELKKKDVARAVNTKWMAAVGSIIVAALGYTNFVQLPAEAAKAAKEQVGPEIVDKANDIVKDLGKKQKDINKIQSMTSRLVPTGGIIPWYPTPEYIKGTTISAPEGWAICDGEKGTPDLRNKFIRGTDKKESIEEGGKEKHTHQGKTEIDEDIEEPKVRGRVHDHGGDLSIYGWTYLHKHNFKTSEESNLPPYRYLVYIMKL